MTVGELIKLLQEMPQNHKVALRVSQTFEPMAYWSFGEGEFIVTKENDFVEIYAEDKE